MNAFEQLEVRVPGPHQAFEDLVGEILIACGLAERRIRVHQGDGGVDAFSGRYGQEGAVTVFQAKYFLRSWGDAQKQQIRDAYATARNSIDFNLAEWRLCTPTRPTRHDVRWFDGWRAKLDRVVDLVDGDDLARLLLSSEAVGARKLLRGWGILGVETDGPLVETSVRVQHRTERSGLMGLLCMFVSNLGGRSAEGLRVSIEHSPTYCVSLQHDKRHWLDVGFGVLNPRLLEARTVLHPGEELLALTIPVVRDTPLPFSIRVKTWVRDAESRVQHSVLTRADLEHEGIYSCTPGDGNPFELSDPAGVTKTLAYPEDLMAETLLMEIAGHPNPEEYGLRHILNGDPNPGRASYLPFVASRGGTLHVMPKRDFEQALSELVNLVWLEPM